MKVVYIRQGIVGDSVGCSKFQTLLGSSPIHYCHESPAVVGRYDGSPLTMTGRGIVAVEPWNRTHTTGWLYTRGGPNTLMRMLFLAGPTPMQGRWTVMRLVPPTLLSHQAPADHQCTFQHRVHTLFPHARQGGPDTCGCCAGSTGAGRPGA